MTKKIFINLPVRDLAASTRFYEAVGFAKNTQFSNEDASAMEWSGAISVMLLSHHFYSTFTRKAIIDARTTSGALLCLTFDDKEAVDAIHRAARDAGGEEPRPIKDQGFMYGGAFEDPDGHTWETVWMDTAAMADAAG
ncbi:VOC family protein [Sphingomicrobium flavum]|uniref:VOC family protein n=1 Tax=Sphingomicrobium flavum TaxID=1229164 RepID=UPI0021AD796F|nr:VOC family protein [Sphingomicrobium flavum]